MTYGIKNLMHFKIMLGRLELRKVIDFETWVLILWPKYGER